MATLLIENLIDAKLTITDTDLYDVVIFGEAEGIKSGGQVISVFGSSDNGGFDADLESYSLALGKSDATLTVGGNYNDPYSYVSRGSYNYYGGQWHFQDYSSSYFKAGSLDGNYNIYHTQFNDDYDSGAVKFSGSNARLVITAQNGAGYANFYDKENGILKTDDAVKLRSDSYGIFSAKTMYNGTAWYGGSGEPSAPAKLTTAYTINAVNTLTVGSDLAGQIETNVAALHAGYRLPNDSNGKPVWGDDSSGNSIIGAGVKAKDLVLESNFRANITTKNNATVFDDALWYSSSKYEAESDSRRKLEERVIEETPENAGTAAAEAGSTEGTTTEERKYFNDGGKNYFNGTTVAALKTATASNNDIISYGIYTTSSLKTGAQSIWAGNISVENSDVNIIADEKYLKPTADEKAPDTTVANASNNSIGAYGIKVDGELNISSMGGLKKDETTENQNGIDQYAKINVTADDNYIIASAKGTKDKAASASIANSTLTAAGIYAGTLKLGAVDSNVEINVTAKNNQIEAFASGGKGSPSANISGTKIDVYGIYASNATFADFYGNVTVEGENNGVQYTGTKTGSSSYTTAGIYVTGSLTSTTNLYGTITVNDNKGVYGIRSGSISVDGVIDTTIISTSKVAGIYAANSLKADAFTGNINVGSWGVGITVIGGALTGTVSGDSFDIAGEIIGAYAVSANSLNVRVSGSITSIYGAAIQSEVAQNFYDTGTVTATKANDNVELAYGSEVYGNIELGALQNTLTVSSGATYSGIISAAEGYLNMTFNLEEYKENHTAVIVTALDENDSVLGQSSTITVNLNYAETGKEYNLIHYYFDASEYWAGDQIAFMYQGYTAQTTLAKVENEDGVYSGDFEIKIGENNSVTGTATFKDNTFSVKVNSKDEDILKDFSTANVKEDYDAKKDEFILSWDNSKIIASDYNLTSVAAYEIEYYLYDKAGKELGKSILVRLDGKTDKYAINGVDNNTDIKWRMRLLGDSTANSVSKWSDWNTGNEGMIEVAVGTEVNADKFSTSVVDASPREGTTGVVAAVANLSWKGMVSDNTIDHYVIEYCTLPDQITLGEIGDASSLDDYIANDLVMTYTKTVTGSEVAISNLQSQTYVYWKIKAVDVNGNESDWQAGETFRVWAKNDTAKPVFEENNKLTGYIVAYELPDDSMGEYKESTKLHGAIGWNHASDTESGVRAYIVEFSTDGGKTFEVYKTVDAEDAKTKSIAEYVNNSLDADKTYRVVMSDNSVSEVAEVKVKVENNTTTKSLVWLGEGDFSGKTSTVEYWDETAGEWKVFAANVQYTSLKYDYTLSLEGLTGAEYAYRIKAVDYFGKESDYIPPNGDAIVLDSKAPAFVSEKSEVILAIDKSDAANVKISPTFTWSRAEDYAEDQGVRYYEIRYRAKAAAGDEENEWISAKIAHDTGKASSEKYEFTFKDENGDGIKLAPQVYEYEIIAYDYFGRTDTLSGTFGSTDMNAPTGELDNSKFKAVIDADYKYIEKEVPVEDENGDPVYVDGKKQYETVLEKTSLNYARVTLSWDDLASNQIKDDSGVIYKVVVSDDINFSPNARTYDFWTTPADGMSITFDENTPGRPSGIFEGMSRVYWYVEVYDVNYNKAATVSAQHYFDFKDPEDGAYIYSDAAPAIPQNVRIIPGAKNEKEVNTDEFSISWTAENTKLGVYSFNIALYNVATGKIDYEASTVDLSDKMTTDMNSAVNVVNNGSYSTFSISDLKGFFGKTSIEDGRYQLIITSKDAYGRVSNSASAPMDVDTVAPGIVNITENTSVSDNRAGNAYSRLILRWEALSDASGIAHYRIEKRKKGDTDEKSWKHVEDVDGSKTEWISTVDSASDTFEYRIIAYDKAGNRGSGYSKEVEIKPVPDAYSDTVANANKLEFADGKAEITDTVGLGDVADNVTFTTTTSEKLTLSVSDLEAVYGYNKSLAINIYKNGVYAAAYHAWDNSRIFTDMLLDANTTYTFSIVNRDPYYSSTKYKFTFEKQSLGAGTNSEGVSKNDTADDVYTADKKITVADNDKAKFSDWVGYGDWKDVRKLELAASGKYDLTLSGMADYMSLHLFEVVTGPGYTYNQYIGAVGGSQYNLDGVSLKNILLDKNKEYFVEIRNDNYWSTGTDYDLTINPVVTFPDPEYPAIEEINNPADFQIVGQWVGFGDQTDIKEFSVGANGGNYEFTFNRPAVGDKEIVLVQVCQDMGKDYWGNQIYRYVYSNYFYAGSNELSTGNLFLANGNYHIIINAVNAPWGYNSHYSVSGKGYEITDDMINDKANNSMDGADTLTAVASYAWVGQGDVVDYYMLDFAPDSDVFSLRIRDVENPLLVTVYQKIEYAPGYTYNAVVSQVVAQKGDTQILSNHLFDKNGEYYVEVNAYGAAWGWNSPYNLDFSGRKAVEFADEIENKNIAVSDSANGWVAVKNSYIFKANENGGSYKFTVSDENGENANGYVWLNIYGYLNNGGKYLVSSNLFDMNYYDSQSTAYLYFDKGVVNGDTGLYEVVVEGYWGSTGEVNLNIDGFAIDDENEPGSGYNDAENKSHQVYWTVDAATLTENSDREDVFKVTVDKTASYTFGIDVINGNANNVMISVGKINDGSLSYVQYVAYGQYGADSIHITTALDAGDYYVKVTALGYNSATEYEFYSGYNTEHPGFNVNDNDFANASAIIDDFDWVGYGDNIDYKKLNVTDSGLHNISIQVDGDPVLATLYKAVKDENGNVIYYSWLQNAYITQNSDKTNYTVFKDCLLDKDGDYYISVQAYGSDTEYKITSELTVYAGPISNKGDFITEDAFKAGKNYAFTAPVTGGSYKFTLTGYAETTGYAWLNVYELLDNGNKRYVSSTFVDVNKGNGGNSGYLYLDENLNGTGVYQVEVKDVYGNASGSLDLDIYGFAVIPEAVADSLNDAVEMTAKHEMDSVPGNVINDNSVVWRAENADQSDYYHFMSGDAGSYTFQLSDIVGNANNVMITVGVKVGDGENAYFQGYYAGYGVYGSDELKLTVNLAADTEYYIKVDAIGYNTATQYDFSIVDNTGRAGYDNTDDAWWLPEKATTTLSDEWVGLGDAYDLKEVGTVSTGLNDVSITVDGDPVVVTLYKSIKDANGNHLYFATLQSAYVTESTDGTIFKDCLLDKDGEYYIGVQAYGSSTEYSLEVKWNDSVNNNLTDTAVSISDIALSVSGSSYVFENADGNSGVYKFTLSGTDTSSGYAWLNVYELLDNGSKRYVSSTFVDVNGKDKGASSANLYLDSDKSYGGTGIYQVEVKDVYGNASGNVKLDVKGFEVDASELNTNDNSIGTARDLELSSTVDDMIAYDSDAEKSDIVDFFKVVVTEDGNYSLEFEGINGNTITASIGQDYNGFYGAHQYVGGAYGSDNMTLSRYLTAGTYYVKVETGAYKSASEYSMTMIHNDARDGFNNEDNTFHQVAADTNAVIYDANSTISDWVGFGDYTDTFKLKLDANSAIILSGADKETQKAFAAYQLSLSLVDANGAGIYLAYDAQSNTFTSNAVLMADKEYYLNVTNYYYGSKNISYEINIAEKKVNI